MPSTNGSQGIHQTGGGCKNLCVTLAERWIEQHGTTPNGARMHAGLVLCRPLDSLSASVRPPESSPTHGRAGLYKLAFLAPARASSSSSPSRAQLTSEAQAPTLCVFCVVLLSRARRRSFRRSGTMGKARLLFALSLVVVLLLVQVSRHA